jgi:hypothetical protein
MAQAIIKVKLDGNLANLVMPENMRFQAKLRGARQ